MYEIYQHEIQDLIGLTEKYTRVPKGLADASLVQAANQLQSRATPCGHLLISLAHCSILCGN